MPGIPPSSTKENFGPPSRFNDQNNETPQGKGKKSPFNGSNLSTQLEPISMSHQIYHQANFTPSSQMSAPSNYSQKIPEKDEYRITNYSEKDSSQANTFYNHSQSGRTYSKGGLNTTGGLSKVNQTNILVSEQDY